MKTQLQLNTQALNEIRLSHARWAGGLGFGTVFVPLADLVVMVTIWTSLLVKIAEATGHPVDKNYAKKFAGTIVKGSLMYIAGSRLGTWLLTLTGVGAPGAMVLNAGLNYGYTWLLGGFLIEQFSKPEVDFSKLGKAAVAYLLSFGMSEVAHLQDLHDGVTTAADVYDAGNLADHASDIASATTDGHHVASTFVDTHHGADVVIDTSHGADGTADVTSLSSHAPPTFGSTYSVSEHADTVRFTGLDHTELIAASQGNQPWCGVHGLGNLVQMNYPGVGEQVNDFILNTAGSHGGLVPVEGGMTVAIAHYQSLLSQIFHIPSHWETFNPLRITELLQNNHGILAVGEGHSLNPNVYLQPNVLHAFNLTDIKVDSNGLTWFKGLDSNMPGQEVWWPADAVQKAVARGCDLYGCNLLVTDQPVAWPWKHSA